MHRAPLPHRVFLHGAGRSGTTAWPSHTPESGTFLSSPQDSTIEGQADALVQGERGRKPLVFAHSIGTVTAVRAVADPAAHPTGHDFGDRGRHAGSDHRHAR